jgi:hypothetical protein
LFGRRISSPRRILFCLPAHSPPIHRFGNAVWPAHLIAAPHSLSFAGAFVADPPIWCCCSAGASHRRAALSFVRPAHSPPIRRFGAISFGRRIPRRAATDLVLFRLAGASPAEPPPIWCCFIWPAHSPPIWSLCLPAHLPPTHRFGVAPFGWRIPSLCHHCLSRLAYPNAHFFAGASPRRTTIALLASAFIRNAALAFGRCIYSPRRPLAFG